MTDRHSKLVEEAVEQFLGDPEANSKNLSLGASVPKELTAILRDISEELKRREPDRLYTANQIAHMARTVCNRKGLGFSHEILGNIRAFGRYLQKYPETTGFVIEGSVGNRRTYKPASSPDSL